MQYNNPNGKWQDVIPYMIILNTTGTSTLARTPSWLMHRKKIKIGSIWKSMRSLSPLSSVTVLQDKEKIKLTDLVFSPAQVTEHHRVELKDQNISQETKDRFVKLKQQYPEVFSLSSQDIGLQTWLLCMLIWEIALPFVKNLTHCLLSITAGFSRKSKHWNVRESSEKASALGPAQSLWYPRNLHLVNP